MFWPCFRIETTFGVSKYVTQQFEHIAPGDALIIGVQVEDAAGKLAAFGAAEHILFQIDVQMPAAGTGCVADGTGNVVCRFAVGRLRNRQKWKEIVHLITQLHEPPLSGGRHDTAPLIRIQALSLHGLLADEPGPGGDLLIALEIGRAHV